MENRSNDLFLKFQKKGFMAIEIPALVKDVIGIMDNRKQCTMTTLSRGLEELGWGFNIMDNETYELIVLLVKGNIS